MTGKWTNTTFISTMIAYTKIKIACSLYCAYFCYIWSKYFYGVLYTNVWTSIFAVHVRVGVNVTSMVPCATRSLACADHVYRYILDNAICYAMIDMN